MTDRRWSARVPLTIGFLAILTLSLGVGLWAVRTEIAGAVIANGVIEVENERQVVQHPDGGVVEKIRVREGDRVSAGDILIELDGTFLTSELAVIEGQLAEVFARSKRLEAERDGSETIEFDEAPIFATVTKDEVTGLIGGQRALFTARLSRLKLEDQQLARQQSQIGRQIEGFQAQLNAIERQLELIKEELTDVETLFAQGLVQAVRLRELLRIEAELEGEIGALNAQMAEAETRISTLEIEKLRLIDNQREAAITELRDLSVTERELKERSGALVERLGRLQIIAPVSGTVFGSRVFAEQSVVQPAEPVLFIVPDDQPLHVSARIDPVDVDQIYAGQEVALVFSAFSRRETPEGSGSIRLVSADAATDDATGFTFYEAVITIDDAPFVASDGLDLVPGMPVEAYIKTEDRTPLTYLVQPLSVYFSRAFREE